MHIVSKLCFSCKLEIKFTGDNYDYLSVSHLRISIYLMLVGDYQRNKKSFYIENLTRKPNDDVAHMKTLMQLTKNNS